MISYNEMESKLYMLRDYHTISFIFDDLNGKETIEILNSKTTGRMLAVADHISVHFDGIEHVPGVLRLTQDGMMVGCIQYYKAREVEVID